MEKALRMRQRGIKGELRELLGYLLWGEVGQFFPGNPSFFLRDLSHAQIFFFGLRTCCPTLPLLLL